MSQATPPDAMSDRPAPAALSPAPPVGGHPITIEVKVRLQAIALPEADGGYSVVVPALPGCVTQGETIEEVVANVVEAAEGWLEAAHDQEREDRLRGMRGE
jgi:predicted RNase H-like HicB family nuclease